MGQFFVETESSNKEAVFGALSSFLRCNPEGKDLFISNKGLEWVEHILLDQSMSTRMQKKVLFLMNDMIEQNIEFFSAEAIVHRLMELLVLANLNLTRNWDTRESILKIAAHILKDGDSKAAYLPIIESHQRKLQSEMTKCEADHKDLYEKELSLVERIGAGGCQNSQQVRN